MRKIASITNVFLFAVAVVYAALPPAAAAAEGDRYWGVKSGLVMVDVDGVDDIIPVTGVLGFGLTPELSVEGEATLSLLGGDVDGGGEVEVSALSVFVPFRAAIDNEKYFKAKVGLVNGEAELCNGGCVSEDDTAPAFGFGLGIRTSQTLTWEIEYTLMEFDDVDIDYLSVGVISSF